MTDGVRIEQLWEDAEALIRSGSSYKARDLLRYLLHIDPSHVAGRTALATILREDGDIDSALVHAAFAYQLSSDNLRLARHLGELYFASGLYAQAEVVLNKVVRSGEKDHSVVRKLALCREILQQLTPDDGENEQ